jgi:hypothetical protein
VWSVSELVLNMVVGDHRPPCRRIIIVFSDEPYARSQIEKAFRPDPACIYTRDAAAETIYVGKAKVAAQFACGPISKCPPNSMSGRIR